MKSVVVSEYLTAGGGRWHVRERKGGVGYSICKCRFRFGLTFRSSLPREPAIEASSFQTVNKWPAKRPILKAPLSPPLLLLLPAKNVFGGASLIPRYNPGFSG